MTVGVLSPPPKFQAFNPQTGGFLVGGQLFTFSAGTSTPINTFIDSTLTTTNTNPIILNAYGECNLWLTPGQAYKLTLEDSAGNVIWTVDQVVGQVLPGATASFGSGFASWTNQKTSFNPLLTPGTGTIAQTSTGFYSQVGSIIFYYVSLSWTSIAGASGNLLVTGFPTAPASISSSGANFGVIFGVTIPNGTMLTINVSGGTTTGILNFGGVADNAVTVAALAANGVMDFSGFYQV